MPLQWLPLDQSIYKKSPISEAIGSQQPSRGQAPSRQFLGTQDTTNYALERMKQEWAMEDKKKKEERDAAMEKAQEMGLRIMAAKEKEKAQYQQMAQQQQKQQMQQVQQIEENPEPAAKELFQFMQTVDEETRQRLLDQLFTPIKTGSITMGDKTMETPSRYNPIAQEFINNGWVTFNPKTGEPEFSMPQKPLEKGAIEIKEVGGKVYQHDTRDGTIIIIDEEGDETFNIENYNDLNSQAMTYASKQNPVNELSSLGEDYQKKWKESYDEFISTHGVRYGLEPEDINEVLGLTPNFRNINNIIGEIQGVAESVGVENIGMDCSDEELEYLQNQFGSTLTKQDVIAAKYIVKDTLVNQSMTEDKKTEEIKDTITRKEGEKARTTESLVNIFNDMNKSLTLTEEEKQYYQEKGFTLEQINEAYKQYRSEKLRKSKFLNIPKSVKSTKKPAWQEAFDKALGE